MEDGEVIGLKRKRRLHMESGNFLAQKRRKKSSVSTSLLNCLKESNPNLLASQEANVTMAFAGLGTRSFSFATIIFSS